MSTTANTNPNTPMLRACSAVGRFWRGLSRSTRLAVIAACGGTLVGVLVTLLIVQESDELSLRQAPRLTEGSTHLALDGEPVLLKAVLDPRPGHTLTYRWSFGDESEPYEGEVTNPFGVSAVHTYPASEAGTIYRATLTVTDESTGVEASTEYPVRFVEPTIENKRSILLDDALWALHASMKRSEDYVVGPVGHWESGGYPVAETAMGILAFEVNGFDARDERKGNPYQTTVERGLTYLLQSLRTIEIKEQPAGDPDSNGNGLGVTVISTQRPLYELPLVTMALVASQDPDRIARVGGEGIRGRRLQDIVIDTLDYLAFAQVDAQGRHRGGWRYQPNSRDADMSVTQWPVLAFMAAKEVWGLDAPAFVKSELRDGYLRHAQKKNGGFGYRMGRNHDNVGLAGAGLIALSFVDVPVDDERFQRTRAYIEKHWAKANVGELYAMYAVMKGASLAETPIAAFGEHDWLAEYVEHLHTTQQPEGHWRQGGNYARGSLLTSWSALVVSKDVFATSRPATIAWGWIVGAASLLLVLLMVCAYWFWLVRPRHRNATRA